MMEKILTSACLLGQRVRYDAGHCRLLDPLMDLWHRQGRLVPLCPELAGGLSTPRPAAEILGGDGGAVLGGCARVVTRDGEDVTAAFLAGAGEALSICQQQGIRFALLKTRSPSCGSTHTYDGAFSGRLLPGSGVTAAQLRQAGVRCFDETQLDALAQALAEAESPRG